LPRNGFVKGLIIVGSLLGIKKMLKIPESCTREFERGAIWRKFYVLHSPMKILKKPSIGRL
jgi:hypothetical protein